MTDSFDTVQADSDYSSAFKDGQMAAGDRFHEDCMRTAAGPEVFHPDNHSVRDLVYHLARFIASSRQLDSAKSALFYGKVKPVKNSDLSELLASGGTSGAYDYDYLTNPQFLHAILGVTSEAGELAEDLLAALEGALLSTENVERETGDIDWFQELLAASINRSVDSCRAGTIDRLRKRFPNSFSEEDALARADEGGPFIASLPEGITPIILGDEGGVERLHQTIADHLGEDDGA